jgi:protein-tyrosine phosphatase
VFNLCSERLYDSSLFEGLVACFPFDDHNCPPLPLLKSFCDSAYDWLKQDMDHMVVVHCKAGKSRTGLMICCLLLYLKVSTHRSVVGNLGAQMVLAGGGLFGSLTLPLAKKAGSASLQVFGVD